MKSAKAPRNVGWFALPLLLSLAAHSEATNIVDPSVSSSETINNSAVRLDGTIFAQSLPTSTPPTTVQISTVWTAEVFARDGECLRFDLTKPVAPDDELRDFELVVIEPNGVVFRNDDRSASDPRPLVKIAPADDGWYTVRVANSFGLGNVFGETNNFTLLYGRYTRGNANCANPTPEAAAMGLSGEEEKATKKREQSSALPSTEASEGAEESETP
jgi:hypothetical protein